MASSQGSHPPPGGRMEQQRHNTGRGRKQNIFPEFKEIMPALRMFISNPQTSSHVQVDLSKDDGLILMGEEKEVQKVKKQVLALYGQLIRADHNISELHKQLLDQKEAQQYILDVLQKVRCFCLFKGYSVQIIAKSDQDIEIAKKLLDASIHERSVPDNAEDELMELLINFNGKILEVTQGDEKKVVYTDDLKKNVSEAFGKKTKGTADEAVEDELNIGSANDTDDISGKKVKQHLTDARDEDRNKTEGDINERGDRKIATASERTDDVNLKDMSRKIDIKDAASGQAVGREVEKNGGRRIESKGTYGDKHMQGREGIGADNQNRSAATQGNSGRNMPDQSHTSGDRSGGRNTGNTSPDFRSQQSKEYSGGSRSSSIKQKVASDMSENGRQWNVQPHQSGGSYGREQNRGTQQRSSGYRDDGRKEKDSGQETYGDNGDAARKKYVDKQMAASRGQQRGGSSSMPEEEEVLYIDGNVADYMSNKMEAELSHTFGARLSFEDGVIRIKGHLSQPEFYSVKDHLQRLACSVHTTEKYISCPSAPRCLMGPDMKETIDNILHDGYDIHVEPIKTCRLLHTIPLSGLTINIYHGSVINVRADTVICPITNSREPSGLSAQHIFAQGGQSMKEKLRSNMAKAQFPVWSLNMIPHIIQNTEYKTLTIMVVSDWYSLPQNQLENMENKFLHSLCKVDENNHSHLAIPLEMGCRIPPAQVAAVLMQSVIKLLTKNTSSTKTLKTISLCLSDLRYLETVMKIFEPYATREHRVHGFCQIDQNPQMQEEGVYLEKAGLLDVKVDAIVATAHHTLDLSKGAVTKMISEHGGDQIQKDCQTQCPKGLGPTETCTVGHGRLRNCQFVILGVLPKHTDRYDQRFCFKRLLENIFKAAKGRQIQSLAIPAIGAGALKYPISVCATEILRSVFIHAEDCGVRTVKIVVPSIYEEFNPYFWKYQDELRSIEECLTRDEEILESRTDTLVATVSEHDRFGQFADVVIAQVEDRKVGINERCDNYVVIKDMEGLHPWMFKKMYIENSSNMTESYRTAFDCALKERSQLITVNLKQDHFAEGKPPLQEVTSLIEKYLEPHNGLLCVKINFIVTAEMKQDMFTELESKSSWLQRVVNKVSGPKITWKRVTKVGKKLPIDGVNMVLTSAKDRDKLQQIVKGIADKFEEFEKQQLEKHKPQVPNRTYEQDAMGTDVDQGHQQRPSSSNVDKSKSDRSDQGSPEGQPKIPDRHPKTGSASNLSGDSKNSNPSAASDNRRRNNDTKVSHRISSTVLPHICERFSTKELLELGDNWQKSGINSEFKEGVFTVHVNDNYIGEFETFLESLKTNLENRPYYIRHMPPEQYKLLRLSLDLSQNKQIAYITKWVELKISGGKKLMDLVKEKLSILADYSSECVDIPNDQLQNDQTIKEKFEAENANVFLELKGQKLVVHCSPDEMSAVIHKLKVQLGIIKITRRKGRQLGNFSSMTQDLSLPANQPVDDQSTRSNRSHSMIPMAHNASVPTSPARQCSTFKAGNNLKVTVYKGDILKVNVNCIVNVTPAGGNADSDNITRQAGDDVLQERQNIASYESLDETGCIATSAGRLNFKKLIHLRALEWEGKEEKSREALFDALKNCLMVADRLAMKSIGIPALSTGDYAIPKEICAQEYCRGIEDFEDDKPNSIEEIHIIFPTDDMVETVSEVFQSRFKIVQSEPASPVRQQKTAEEVRPAQTDRRRINVTKTATSGTTDPGSFEVHGIQIKVYTGDILKLDVDCIVNAANESLEHGGGVARVIARAAGRDFQQESYRYIRKNGYLNITDCIATSAGNLKYSNVLHAVGPRWRSSREVDRTRRELRKTIVQCLLCVEQLGLQSVGIPSISAGIFGVPKDICAEEYGRGILEFCEQYDPKILKEVHFVDVAADIVRIVSGTFTKMFASKPAPSSTETSNAGRSLSVEQRRSSDTGSDLRGPDESMQHLPNNLETKKNKHDSKTSKVTPERPPLPAGLELKKKQQDRTKQFASTFTPSPSSESEKELSFQRSISLDETLPKKQVYGGADRRSGNGEKSHGRDVAILKPSARSNSSSGSQRRYQSPQSSRDNTFSQQNTHNSRNSASEVGDVSRTQAEGDPAPDFGSRKKPYKFFPFNNPGIVIKVYKQDISMCRVDAVVSILESRGRENSQIAQSVRKVVGLASPNKFEISKVRDLETIVKPVSTASFQYVIYANLPSWKTSDKFKREMKKCIGNVFESAGRNDISSIAFPVLGLFGTSAAKPEECCQILADGVMSFCSNLPNRPSTIREIHLIGYDEGLVYCLKEAVTDQLDVKQLAHSQGNNSDEWKTTDRKGSHK